MLAPMTHLPKTLLPMTHSSPLLHWEDFPVGHQLDTAGMPVDRDAILAFARQFDPQPFHVDEAAARESLFGGFLVWAVFSFCAARQRDREGQVSYPAGRLGPTLVAVGVGLVAWAGFAFWAHAVLIGVRPFG